MRVTTIKSLTDDQIQSVEREAIERGEKLLAAIAATAAGRDCCSTLQLEAEERRWIAGLTKTRARVMVLAAINLDEQTN